MVMQCINSATEREKALASSKVAIINAKPTLSSKITHEPIDIGIIKPDSKKHMIKAREHLGKLINKFKALAGEGDEDYNALCMAANEMGLALEDMEDKK